jgi:hypothetical protein
LTSSPLPLRGSNTPSICSASIIECSQYAKLAFRNSPIYSDTYRFAFRELRSSWNALCSVERVLNPLFKLFQPVKRACNSQPLLINRRGL